MHSEPLTFSSKGERIELHPYLEGANTGGISTEQLDRIVAAQDDPLAEQVLARGEPNWSVVTAALPRLVDTTFVGDPRCDERFIIQPDGAVAGLLGPLTDLPFDALARYGRWGLIDRRLPLPVLQVDSAGAALREQIVVADLDARGQPRLLVRRRTGGTIDYLALTGLCDSPQHAFDAAVVRHQRLVREFHEEGIDLAGGDELLADLARASLWLADLTLRGCRPRYGIGTYDRFKDHSFPPTIIHLGQCLLEWGHFRRAADILSCYLDAYVADDGTFMYYGPAVSEYGQFLSLCVRYVELTGDLRWWLCRQSVLRRIWRRLLRLRDESSRDVNAPPGARGLIPGLPEADYHGSPEQWRQYYYSGDAWAVRGLTDVARLLRRSGDAPEAAYIEAEVADYRRDLLASVNRAAVETEDGIYVPPGPTQRRPIQRMTQNRHSSYCNYRYFAEMVSAGVFPAQVVQHVISWRRRHGGELLAMTRFEDRLDDWPVINWARAMLETGDVAHYQLLLYAHLAHHQCAGWLSAPEQVHIRPDASGVRRCVAGQVVPCQVTAPLLLRWALLYEMRDEDTLLVAPAVAYHWIDGKRLTAGDLPTRWGPMALSLHSDGKTVSVSLRLPAAPPATLGVRLPRPSGATLRLTTVTGAASYQWEAGASVVMLSGCRSHPTVVAEIE